MGDHPSPDEPTPPGPDEFEAEESLDPLDAEETQPTAWYRRPVVLIGWGLMVLILIALIVYGIIELIGDQGTGSTPSTTTTPSHTTTTTTTTPSTTPPSSATTTTTAAPPTSSAVQPPAHEPTQQQPTHRHHWPSWLPTTVPALP
jgi:cytoskeletal protein RodZ